MAGSRDCTVSFSRWQKLMVSKTLKMVFSLEFDRGRDWRVVTFVSVAKIAPAEMVGSWGLEPQTSTVSRWRSNQLSYEPKVPLVSMRLCQALFRRNRATVH